MADLTARLILEMVDRVTGPAREVTATVERLHGRIAENTKQVTAARSQVVGATAAFAAFGAAIWGPVNAAVAFESAMADVAKVSDFDDAGLAEYGRELRELSVTEIPLAVEELAALSAAASESGVAKEDLLDFTRMTAKAAVAWGMSGDAAGENLAKIMTQLRLTTAGTEVFASAINHLSDNTASSAGDLVGYARQVSAQGEFFGYSAEETLAFGSAMVSAGAQSEVAATSFRNMGRALTRGASATNRQAAAMQTLGLDSVDVAMRMQEDAVGVTLEVIEAIGRLPAHVQAATVTDLFGDESRAIAPLLKQVDLLKDTLALVATEAEYAGSVNEEFARRAATAEYEMQRLRNQVRDVGVAIGDALIPALKDVMGAMAPVLRAMGDWATENPKIVSGIIAATGALVGFRLAIALLRLAGLMAMGGYLRTVAFGLGTIGGQAARIGSAASESMRLNRALATMQGVQAGKLSQIGAALRGIAYATGLMSVATLGPVAIAIGAVAAAGYLMWRYWDRIRAVARGVARAIGERFQPAIEALQPVLEPLAPVLDVIGAAFSAVGDAVSTAVGWIGDLLGTLGEREILTADQEADAEARAYRVAQAIIRAINPLPMFFTRQGREAISGLLDGMRERFTALINWVREIPRRIRDAMPSINLADYISAPDWLQNLIRRGGDDDEPVQRHAAGGWYGPGPRLVGEGGARARIPDAGRLHRA